MKATLNPLAPQNIAIRRPGDHHQAARRYELLRVLTSDPGQAATLQFPDRQFPLGNRAIETSVFENDGALLLSDELRPHMVLMRAGATVLDVGAVQRGYRCGSVDPSLQAGWATSTELATETNFSLIEPRRLCCHITYSTELARLQPDLAVAYVERQLFSAIAAGLENAALLGTGAAGQPVGILNDPAIQTIDLAVGETAFAEAERAISESYHEGDLAILTSPKIRQAMRSAAVTDDLSGQRLPRYFSPHLQGAGNVAGDVAIVGNFADLLIAHWGPIQIQSNPFSRDVEGLTRLLIELTCDVIATRPGAFRVVNPTA